MLRRRLISFGRRLRTGIGRKIIPYLHSQYTKFGASFQKLPISMPPMRMLSLVPATILLKTQIAVPTAAPIVVTSENSKLQVNVLPNNIDTMETKTIFEAIWKNQEFAKAFAEYVIRENKIDLLCQVQTENYLTIKFLFKAIDEKGHKEFAEYLAKNLNKITCERRVVDFIIFESPLFCNLVAEQIISGKTDINILKKTNAKSLMFKLSDENKCKIFRIILDNIDKIDLTIIDDAVQQDYKFSINTFNEQVIEHIIEKKDFRLLKYFGAHTYSHLINYFGNNRIIEPWTKFLLNNLSEIHKINKYIIDVTARNKTFKCKLIDHMHAHNEVITNCLWDTLKNLYDDIPSVYKRKLETLYLNNYKKIKSMDAEVIAQYWDLSYNDKLLEKLTLEADVETKNIVSKMFSRLRHREPTVFDRIAHMFGHRKYV